jgi:hypothetical protein
VETLSISKWILRNSWWLWFLWVACAITAWKGLHSAVLVWVAFAALAGGILLSTIAAVYHFKHGFAAARELFAEFPKIIGNPRAPRAIFQLAIFLLLLLITTKGFIPAIAKWAASH